jgi:hypothetical protein
MREFTPDEIKRILSNPPLQYPGDKYYPPDEICEGDDEVYIRFLAERDFDPSTIEEVTEEDDDSTFIIEFIPEKEDCWIVSVDENNMMQKRRP